MSGEEPIQVSLNELTRVEFNPRAFPICGTCNAAFVMRRVYLLSDGEAWVWQRDCGHKKASAVVEVSNTGEGGRSIVSGEDAVEPRRYRGRLRLGDDGEGWDILFLDDGSYPEEPLAERVLGDRRRFGDYLTVRYWTAPDDHADDELKEGALRHIMGIAEVDYGHRYSDITGYLWTDEALNVGGHDLLSELKSKVGQWCLLEIDYAWSPIHDPR